MTVGGAVLVVEDDDKVRRTLQRILRRGPELVMAGSQAAGVQALAMRGDWLAFLIDIRLPDGDGLDVLEKAARRFPGRPSLVLTGDIDWEHVNRAARLGAKYSLKPFDLEVLEAFQTEAIMASRRFDQPSLAAVFANYAGAHGFSPAEVELFSSNRPGLDGLSS